MSLTFADLAMSDRFGWVLVIALLAIMTVTAGGEVTTFQAYAARHASR